MPASATPMGESCPIFSPTSATTNVSCTKSEKQPLINRSQTPNSSETTTTTPTTTTTTTTTGTEDGSGGPVTTNTQSILAMFSAALLITSVCNNIFFKQMTNAMINHPFFLSQLSTVVYIPVFFGIVWLRSSEISPEMRAFPKMKFFYMGLFDAFSGVLSMIGAIHTGGGLQALLSNAIIPCTMLLSWFYINEKFNKFQIIGSSMITLAVVLAVLPLFFGHGGTDEAGGENQLIFVLLFVLNNIPSAFGSVYKEAVFTELDMNENYLQAWVALFQLILGILLVPLNTMSILGRDAVQFRDIPGVLSRGFWCLLGYNMIVKPHCMNFGGDYSAMEEFMSAAPTSAELLLPPCDTCHGAWIPVVLYLAANLFYNWLMVVIIKIPGGGASLLYVIMALRLPLVQLAFASSFIQNPPEQLHLLHVIVLALILLGLYLYNSGGGSTIATSARLNINWLKVDSIQQMHAARRGVPTQEEHTVTLRHEWISTVLSGSRAPNGTGALLSGGALRREQERQLIESLGLTQNRSNHSPHFNRNNSYQQQQQQQQPQQQNSRSIQNNNDGFPFSSLLLHTDAGSNHSNTTGSTIYGTMGMTKNAIQPPLNNSNQLKKQPPTETTLDQDHLTLNIKSLTTIPITSGVKPDPLAELSPPTRLTVTAGGHLPGLSASSGPVAKRNFGPHTPKFTAISTPTPVTPSSSSGAISPFDNCNNNNNNNNNTNNINGNNNASSVGGIAFGRLATPSRSSRTTTMIASSHGKHQPSLGNRNQQQSITPGNAPGNTAATSVGSFNLDQSTPEIDKNSLNNTSPFPSSVSNRANPPLTSTHRTRIPSASMVYPNLLESRETDEEDCEEEESDVSPPGPNQPNIANIYHNPTQTPNSTPINTSTIPKTRSEFNQPLSNTTIHHQSNQSFGPGGLSSAHGSGGIGSRFTRPTPSQLGQFGSGPSNGNLSIFQNSPVFQYTNPNNVSTPNTQHGSSNGFVAALSQTSFKLQSSHNNTDLNDNNNTNNNNTTKIPSNDLTTSKSHQLHQNNDLVHADMLSLDSYASSNNGTNPSQTHGRSHGPTPQLSSAGRSFIGSTSGAIPSRLLNSAAKPSITALSGATALLSPGINHVRLQGGSKLTQQQSNISTSSTSNTKNAPTHTTQSSNTLTINTVSSPPISTTLDIPAILTDGGGVAGSPSLPQEQQPLYSPNPMDIATVTTPVPFLEEPAKTDATAAVLLTNAPDLPLPQTQSQIQPAEPQDDGLQVKEQLQLDQSLEPKVTTESQTQDLVGVANASTTDAQLDIPDSLGVEKPTSQLQTQSEELPTQSQAVVGTVPKPQANNNKKQNGKKKGRK